MEGETKQSEAAFRSNKPNLWGQKNLFFWKCTIYVAHEYSSFVYKNISIFPWNI